MTQLVARFPRRLLLLAAIVLIAVAVITYYVLRPAATAPPIIDLTRADPEVADAIRSAVAAVEDSPREAAAWGKLGMVLRAHDFDSESVQALREAERLDPADARWPYLQGLTLLLAQPDDGIACLKRAVERVPAANSTPRLRLAESLFELGRLDDAEAHARTAGEANPRAALTLARIAAARGNWDAVLALTAGHRDESRTRKQMATLRGQALARSGHAGDADIELQRAAKLPNDEGWDDPYVREVERLKVGNMAMLPEAGRLLSEGRGSEAIPLLERAVRRSPDAVEPRLLLAQARQLAGDSRGSRDLLLELTRSHPGAVEAWFHLGVAQFSLGDAAGAAGSFAEVVRLKPDHALGYYNLAHALRKKGDRAGAVKALEQALRCRPDYEPARALLREMEK